MIETLTKDPNIPADLRRLLMEHLDSYLIIAYKEGEPVLESMAQTTQQRLALEQLKKRTKFVTINDEKNNDQI